MWSGLAGAGALDELERLVMRQQREEQLREQARARRTQEEFNRKQFESIDKDREERRDFTRQQRAMQEQAMQAAGEAAGDQRRARSNISGLMLMRGQLPPEQLQNEVLAQATERDVDLDPAVREAIKPPAPPPEPRKRAVVVPGPNGRPVSRMVPEDEEVEVWREPKVDRAESTTDLSPEALDLLATTFVRTGQLPPMGMGASSLRAAIYNRAGELFPDADVATEASLTRADRASLGKMTQQLDAITAFEQTAEKNLKVFEDLAKKIGDTGSPLLNMPMRRIQERGLGGAELAAFNAARRVVVPEYARIIANPNLTGVLSDSARHEIEEIISGNATLGQIAAVGAVLRQDAQNRKDAIQAQIEAATARSRRQVGGAAPTGGPSVGERRSINGQLAEWDGKGWKAVR